jgi:hypothetical protein
MAEPSGTDPAHCYKRFPYGEGTHESFVEVCGSEGGTLASFTSPSEFSAVGAACADPTPEETYFEHGCWLDGVTDSGYVPEAPNTYAWHWGTSGATNDFLVNSGQSLWSGGEPSGYMINIHPEHCLQVFVGGLLNDYPCYAGLAGVCMIDAIQV